MQCKHDLTSCDSSTIRYCDCSVSQRQRQWAVSNKAHQINFISQPDSLQYSVSNQTHQINFISQSARVTSCAGWSNQCKHDLTSCDTSAICYQFQIRRSKSTLSRNLQESHLAMFSFESNAPNQLYLAICKSHISCWIDIWFRAV